ncbi:MAG: NADH-quinone oxidoreductase subunit J [Austwickia sp.]|jgi:NADH-quinone oxidoreductase subunit J|nr:NADH-quinone oxidoreductase subunit J [Austwickia sp.]MBK8436118.1 NADH-quinone oxidoreductase subunit J [Austwickia sp.]MBK9101797.1 NADH-quinone oxidoreductase subunit J [Austwickia sp.]
MDTSTGEAVLFWVAGPMMVLAGMGLLFVRKAVYAALSMALLMVLMGVLYLAQGADFLGIIQIFVYTGAVMMLFLFVIMLIGVDASDTLVDTIKGHRWASLLLVLGLSLLLITTIGSVAFRPATGLAAVNREGNVSGMANLIFGPYVWVFEITSALLVTAALAAIVLAHRQRLLPKPTQREWSRRRFRENRYVAGLPAPGVYARHNAVDTPALLPDGSPSELSVSRVLQARGQIGSPTVFVESTDEVEREIQEGSAR